MLLSLFSRKSISVSREGAEEEEEEEEGEEGTDYNRKKQSSFTTNKPVTDEWVGR